MAKLDFKTTLKSYFTAPVGEFVVVDIPMLPFVMVDGHGDPNVSPDYKVAVEALFGLSYKLKFISKAAGRDYVVGPLQGLWWADDMADFVKRAKGNWSWTVMIMQPDWTTEADLGAAVDQLRKKGNAVPESLRLEPFAEGKCIQTLHIGSYDEEGPILHRLHHDFLPANGFVETGKHHEIYLSDPRRVAPAKLKTILRQPVRPASSKTN
jgi:hypothetical protein